MKKYLIPTLISAVALATPAFADDGLLPTLESATRISGTKPTEWSENIGDPSSITASDVGGNYSTGVFSSTGWYWGLANMSNTSSFDSDFSINSETSFSYAGRQNYGGEYVAAVVELSGLLSTDELLSGFTISFDMESSNSEGFHAYYVNTATYEAVEFTDSADVSSGTFSYTWDASDYEMDGLSDEYALIFIWNGKSGGGVVTVSDLSSSYTVTTLPEPSMFGLFFGLGALGLVSTRRRRKVA